MSGCIDFADLVDYWSGDSDQDERIEAHVFECDSCTRRLGAVQRLARGIAGVARRRGGLVTGLTRSLVAELAAGGVRMRHYSASPGEQIACTIGRDDDLLVTYLKADLRGARKLAILMRTPEGAIVNRLDDAPLDAVHDEVIYTLAGDVMREHEKHMKMTTTIFIELVSVENEGERLLGRYQFDHTPGGA